MKEEKVSRNGLIDIMRLGFAALVMMFHFYSDRKHFIGGFLGVEFFMILAGFLMFSAWNYKNISSLPEPKRQSYWLRYMKERYCRFFWYCLIAFILAFLALRIWRDRLSGIVNIFDALSGDIWEILLVSMNGIGKGMLNGPAWTLSCMLFAQFAILGLLTLWQKPFLLLIMPLGIIFGTGYWANLESLSTMSFLPFFTVGMLQVLLLTCFGIPTYFTCQWLKRQPFSTAGRGGLTVLELLGYTVCIIISFCRDSRHYRLCFCLIIILTLAISFSGKSFAGSMLPANTFTNFCAELSLSLYLTHWPVLKAFQYIYPDINDLYRQKFVFLYCALAVALVYTYTMRGVFKMLPIVKEKLKSIMLEQS